MRKWTRRGLLLLAAHATFCTGGIQLWDKGCPLQNCPLELKDFFHRTSPISTLRESSPTQKQKGQDLFLSLSLLTLRTPLPKHRALSQEKRGALDTRGKAVNTVGSSKTSGFSEVCVPRYTRRQIPSPEKPRGTQYWRESGHIRSGTRVAN